MTNYEKYVGIFLTCFGVEEKDLEKLNYQDVPSWDSVGHMGLIAALEDAFNIMMETDDIIDFSSFEKGKNILAKYGIEI